MAGRIRFISYIGLLALIACGGEPTTQGRKSCVDDARAATYAAGLETPSMEGMFMSRLVDGTPAPPDRGNNTWMLEILDPSGSPMSEVTDVRVKAWMPDHGHGTNPLWNPATEQPDGEFEVGPFNLFMPGLWQFTVEVTTPTQTDTAVVSFCVQG